MIITCSPRYPKPTIEDLNSAQEDLDEMELEADAFRKMCSSMSDDLGEDVVATQLSNLERLMKPTRKRVAMIQYLMEEPEPDPSQSSEPASETGTNQPKDSRP